MRRADKKNPDFIVLGQGKSGTSLIYQVFTENPAIGLPTPKELNFFSRDFDKGMDWYRTRFPDLGHHTVLGEISPSYLSSKAVKRIAGSFGSNVKIIFILRRPIEQFYSRYLQNLCAMQKSLSFHGHAESKSKNKMKTIIKAIQSCYDEFGEENVLPLFFEKDVAVEKPSFERKIYEFIGIDSSATFYNREKHASVNKGVMPRYLYSGDNGLSVVVDDHAYHIPPRKLVFCGQKRNSKVYDDVSESEVAAAFTRQSYWTTEITKTDYKKLYNVWVEPLARKLEKQFGFDMEHWRIPPRHISYGPAPPPKQFQTGVWLGGVDGLRESVRHAPSGPAS